MSNQPQVLYRAERFPILFPDNAGSNYDELAISPRTDANDLPTNRQCFSILLDNATFSPTSVHAGDVS